MAARSESRKSRKQEGSPAGPGEGAEKAANDREKGREDGLFVVGVGGSAGGMEAFQDLLHHVPETSDLAFVFISHLDPKRESILGPLLSKSTTMKVLEVKKDTPIEPNHVYVIAPNTGLSLDRMNLKPSTRDGRSKPIDFFMRSLAEQFGPRAIGVVLSGNNSDGSLGLQAIKGGGGVTFAQDDSAKFPTMPRTAEQAGFVDFVLPPADIATELVTLTRSPLLYRDRKVKTGDGPELPDDHLQLVFRLLRRATGVDFTLYKPSTIKRRIMRRMLLQKLDNLQIYASFLENNPKEVDALYEDLLINVTGFFREADAFDALKRTVLPELVRERAPQNAIRVGVPGCSTGEQVYSIAVTLLEFLATADQRFPIQIFGTDVSETAIARARSGRYPSSIRMDVSEERLRKYFSLQDDHYLINKDIRDMCVFARQNLVQDPPFSRLDLIYCSNVLIYLGPVLQKRVIPIFHYALKKSGYLLLGGSETIGAFAELFSLIDKRHKIYVKKNGAARVDVDFSTTAPLEHAERDVQLASATSQFDMRREAERILLDRYAPPGIVINDQNEVVHFRGRTGFYLEPAPGPATMNVLKMAREGLLPDLREAVQRCQATGGVVRKEDVKVRTNDHYETITLEVMPLRGPTAPDHYYVVTFAAPAHPPAPTEKEKKKNKKATRTESEYHQVRRELDETREDLQAIIEEKEAANEELKAANEEIQSANEELQSTNEELQSTNEELQTAKEELQPTNEELTTINEELQSRNFELSEDNNDLSNLLTSVHLPIVMLGRNLRIRRFTPMAEKLFNIIPTDVGRPISDIKPKIDVPDLEGIIRGVLESLSIYERQVQDQDGRWYSMRIRPYQTTENRIDGAILALVEVDAAHTALAEQLQQARHDLQAMAEAIPNGLLLLDEKRVVETANARFCETFRLANEDVEGRSIFELGGGEWNLPRLHHLLEVLMTRKARVEHFVVEHRFESAECSKLLLNCMRVSGPRHRLALSIQVVA